MNIQSNNHGHPHTGLSAFVRGLVALWVLILPGCSSRSSNAPDKENACREMQAMELVTSGLGLREYSVYFPK